ncbi:hypothetical protein, partial [Aeromonas sp. QDB50]|uniref:hypothetical protein n=1 Tax=Aeromonas sp. QDB50 TaxID=2990493 RepID=UPI0022E8B9A9
GDKIRSQTKPFLYLFQLVGAKDPVHETLLAFVSSYMSPCGHGKLTSKRAALQPFVIGRSHRVRLI